MDSGVPYGRGNNNSNMMTTTTSSAVVRMEGNASRTSHNDSNDDSTGFPFSLQNDRPTWTRILLLILAGIVLIAAVVVGGGATVALLSSPLWFPLALVTLPCWGPVACCTSPVWATTAIAVVILLGGGSATIGTTVFLLVWPEEWLPAKLANLPAVQWILQKRNDLSNFVASLPQKVHGQ